MDALQPLEEYDPVGQVTEGAGAHSQCPLPEVIRRAYTHKEFYRP